MDAPRARVARIARVAPHNTKGPPLGPEVVGVDLTSASAQATVLYGISPATAACHHARRKPPCPAKATMPGESHHAHAHAHALHAPCANQSPTNQAKATSNKNVRRTQSRVAQPETSREAARIRLVDHARHSLGNQNQAANNGHRSTKPESS